MLTYYLLALAAEVPVPEVPEPVTDGLWSFLRDFLLLMIAAATCWWTVIRPWWGHMEKKRERERDERDRQRQAEIAKQVEAVVAPIREQVDAIHHTTHTNGGKNDPPTMRDDLCNLRERQETTIKAVGAVAVNQARLTDRFDQHEEAGEEFLRQTREALEKQGIHLPEIEPSKPDR